VGTGHQKVYARMRALTRTLPSICGYLSHLSLSHAYYFLLNQKAVRNGRNPSC
jgi:hypothetical protein